MLHEKPDKTVYWQTELDSLNQLPGEPETEKTAAWEKLHSRLQKKPHHQRKAWYRTAAACFIFLAGTAWLVNYNRGTGFVQSNDQPTVAVIPFIHAAKTVAVNPQPLQQKISTATLRENKKGAHHASTPPSILKREVLIDDEVNKPSHIAIADSAMDIDTIALTAALPQKKKMRVVHLNELDGPVEAEAPFAQHKPALLRTRLLNRDDYPGYSLTRNTSDNILKIKLASN